MSCLSSLCPVFCAIELMSQLSFSAPLSSHGVLTLSWSDLSAATEVREALDFAGWPESAQSRQPIPFHWAGPFSTWRAQILQALSAFFQTLASLSRLSGLIRLVASLLALYDPYRLLHFLVVYMAYLARLWHD